MAKLLDGKVIVVTGAGGGIGREIAIMMADAGAKVIINDIGASLHGEGQSATPAEQTKSLINQRGGQAEISTDSVAGWDSARKIIQSALDHFGRIDGVVNNAALYGSLRGGRFNQIAETDWDAAMAVNVKGIWNCCKAAVPALRHSGGGSIVNIASLAATYGMPFALHYTTSKAAVIGLTRGLARELGRDNIRVNAVAPSAVMTEGTVEFLGEKYERGLEVIRSGQSIQRTLEPSDLVGTIAWLIAWAFSCLTSRS